MMRIPKAEPMILKIATSALLFWGAFVTKTRFVVPVGKLMSFMSTQFEPS